MTSNHVLLIFILGIGVAVYFKFFHVDQRQVEDITVRIICETEISNITKNLLNTKENMRNHVHNLTLTDFGNYGRSMAVAINTMKDQISNFVIQNPTTRMTLKKMRWASDKQIQSMSNNIATQVITFCENKVDNNLQFGFATANDILVILKELKFL